LKEILSSEMYNYRRQIEESDRAVNIVANFWLNSEPIFFESLRGRVVLLLFFNYASREWIELSAYLKEWERRYFDKGFFMLGVHVPKFPFEANVENVSRELKRLGINFPIAVDNDWINLSRYKVRELPTIILINRDGLISYTHIGTRRLWEVEFNIQSLLIKAGYRGDFPLPIGSRYEFDESVFYKVIPEIYTSYSGGSLGNPEGFAPEGVIKYEDPEIYINGKFYLSGEWYNGKHFFKHQPVETSLGVIILPYIGTNVGMVAESTSGEEINLIVTQDGEPLSDENRGEDVFVECGQSYVRICEPRYYEIVNNFDYGEHILKLFVVSESFAIYKFSISAFRTNREPVGYGG
jgi:hypothetical protein